MDENEPCIGLVDPTALTAIAATIMVALLTLLAADDSGRVPAGGTKLLQVATLLFLAEALLLEVFPVLGSLVEDLRDAGRVALASGTRFHCSIIVLFFTQTCAVIAWYGSRSGTCFRLGLMALVFAFFFIMRALW